jgi:DNA-binding transcriptional MerR regulator
MERRYRVRDFSRITGVTVKALQHYDRLGLLRPSRTPSGHRIYSDRDVERLQQIVALKSIGVPLKKIKAVLDGNGRSLAAALKSQYVNLEEERRGDYSRPRGSHARGDLRGPGIEAPRRVADHSE